jgi:hypothetical protein
MRDRLIELIKNAEKAFPKEKPVLDIEEFVADHLLANGVVIPPVSVGQTVWVYNQTTNNIYRNTVIGIKIFGTGKNANKIIVKYVNQRGETSDRKFAWSQIGKQVFLSEEEAVQALVERSGK